MSTQPAKRPKAGLTILTGGGTHSEGDVSIGGDFISRDQSNHTVNNFIQ